MGALSRWLNHLSTFGSSANRKLSNFAAAKQFTRLVSALPYPAIPPHA